jgi:L-alanine-DL-glutamate epimerase-like enolase superfamily enzyme
VLQCDVMDASALVAGMDHRVIGHLPGKAAIDAAMWDLRGKLLGQPVARLLGGVRQWEFDAFQAISLGTPKEMVEELKRMSDLGFRRWQLKLGNDPLEDAARTQAIAHSMPASSAFLTSDANKGWTVAQALRFVNAIIGIDTYLEQPCATIGEMARVHRRSSIPLMIDESAKQPSDVLDALSAGCADAINLKPVRVGGLTKAALIRDLAETAGLMILVDEPQGADLATAGMAHLAATVDPDHFLGVSYFMGNHMPMSYQPEPLVSGPGLLDGRVQLSAEPGLGVEIDEAVFGAPLFSTLA